MKLARPLIVAVLTLAVVVSLPVAVAATNGTGLQQETAATAAAQDPAAVEASLGLDRPSRRLIQQGLRNEGVDPGTPDGLFGPRTRAAIQDWQQSRGASPTGYLNRAEAELLRTAAAPPAAISEASPPPEAAPNVNASALSDAVTPASTAAETDSHYPQNAAPTNAEQQSRAAIGSENAQLPPEILVDRHLVRAERLLEEDDAPAALETLNAILSLQREHGLALGNDFHFRYAQVALAAGRTDTAIASLNDYLLAGGRGGEFYREALELLDSTEVILREEERGARWPPGRVFRDCELFPEMVVLPGGRLALGRYELTVGEYRAFAAATGGGAGRGCQASLFVAPDSWRDPGHPQTDRHPVTRSSRGDRS